MFRQTLASNALVGSYCALSNQGGMVNPRTSADEQDELSSLLQVRWSRIIFIFTLQMPTTYWYSIYCTYTHLICGECMSEYVKMVKRQML